MCKFAFRFEFKLENMISYLQIDKLTKSFGDLVLFEDITFGVAQGQKIGLIAKNGTGKTTLLNIIGGKEDYDSGEVVFRKDLRVGYLEQSPSYPEELTVLQACFHSKNETVQLIAEYEEAMAKEDHSNLEDILTRMDSFKAWDYEQKAKQILGQLKIHNFNQKIGELSGGQLKRVALANVLITDPELIILDEPTNHLDLEAIRWLEDFLIEFDNTVIVVSHDRYFLNKVCTHIADIDYAKIQLYAGNYDFWYESSQLIIKQMKEANKKKEEKIKELQEFIQRFSANASKSKQATSRKRALEKIELDDMKPSSRKYPYIDFRPEREIGNEVLTVEHLSKTIDGVKVLDDISFIIGREDKVAFVGSNTIAATTLFQILSGEMEPDEGSYKWGVTTSFSYFPKDNTELFASDDTIVDWLMPFSPEKDPTYVRGFLGRMLFPGEDGVKKVNVLSGGERVRVMLSKMMILASNILIMDEPTNHLDMESITALNNGLIKFSGVVLFTSQDHQFIQTIANRIMEITPGGLIDKISTYDEYLDSDEMARKRQLLSVQNEDED